MFWFSSSIKFFATSLANFWDGAWSRFPYFMSQFTCHPFQVRFASRFVYAFVMMRSMLSLCCNYQILRSVIRTHSVDVMNNFTLREWASKQLRHHKCVFSYVAAFVCIWMVRLCYQAVALRDTNAAIPARISLLPPRVFRPSHRYRYCSTTYGGS